MMKREYPINNCISENSASKPRVALFLSEYSITSQTTNAAKMFVDNGYCVDVFIYNTKNVFDDFDENENLKIYDLSGFCGGMTSGGNDKANKSLFVLVKNLIVGNARRGRLFRSLLRNALNVTALIFKRGNIIPEKIIHESQGILGGKEYKCFIGIERMGFIWASILSSDSEVPCVYFSLELYTADYTNYWSLRFFSSKRLERKYHKRAVATIIQDEERASVLLSDNQVQAKQKIFFVPVSLMGEGKSERKDLLREKFSIPSDTKIILYIGHIDQNARLSLDLARMTQKLPDRYVMVMHGVASARAIEEINEINHKRKVLLSLEKVEFSELRNIISSADIGCCFYPNIDMNHYLTGSSSEKMALYTQAGLPIISFNYPSFKKIYTKYGCGVGISSLDELVDAADNLMASYAMFSGNSLKCYDDHYRFDRHFQNVMTWVDTL